MFNQFGNVDFSSDGYQPRFVILFCKDSDGGVLTFLILIDFHFLAIFVIHVDDVSARLSAALMLRAQIELSMANGDETPDEAEKAAIEQLKSDLDRYESHHHEGAFLDLGLAMAKLASKLHDHDWERQILNKLAPHIIPEFIAHRA
ncbi:MAG: hypothetical protein II509_01725, partial [Prevotella sp.]|nr:hypothetical protein [Prevotella sp.]